jgi:hypothetical protein
MAKKAFLTYIIMLVKVEIPQLGATFMLNEPLE